MSEIVIKAANFAADAHTGQTRKDGVTPYISHPTEVARLCRQRMNPYVVDQDHRDRVSAIALLHDTIEDCDVTYEDLKELFGADVAVPVRELTEPEGPFSSVAEKHRAKDKYLRDFKGKSPEACLVKLCDRLHNIGDWEGMQKSSQLPYMATTFKLFEGIMLNKRVHKSPLWPAIMDAMEDLFELMIEIKDES